MKYQTEPFEYISILPEKFNFTLEPKSNLTNEIEPIFLVPLELNPPQLVCQKKKLFSTKIEKTSFITLKRTNKKSVKKSDDNSVSKGRWTQKERIQFAFGLYKFGADWKKIKNYISTRDMIQLRSHGQKFLEKLKKDQFIIQKGLDFKNLNWKESIDYLKENLSEDEFLNILYSIESELGDNKRMTEKYLEKKRLKLKNDSSSIEEASNTALSSLDNKLNEEQVNDENERNNFSDIISIEEENKNKNDLYKNNFGKDYFSDYNVFKKCLFSFEENSIDSELESLEYKNELNFLFKP